MQSFIQRHHDQIRGVLSGLDGIRFRGALRAIAHPWGLHHFLLAAGVLLKDFKDYVLSLSRQNDGPRSVQPGAARPTLSS
jgi:hypothetical protein